jgi:hypothetical protein
MGLCEHCGNDVSAATIDELVVPVLDILGKSSDRSYTEPLSVHPRRAATS